MEPQIVSELGITNPPHRSFAGHVLALGAHVLIFGVLAYLAFLAQGGVPGQLLLIYVSALPLAFAIGTVREIARAKNKMAAHHVIAGCLNAVLLCGLGGILLAFGNQIVLTLIGSLALVWVTRYSPIAEYIRPPRLSEVTTPPTGLEHRTLRALATIACGLVLLVAGLALTVVAVYGQMERPGGLHITIGGP
ncbi:MAG TPA: hypothetical protein VFL29_07120 [Candidatus Dormibacteraeota bacterium]|nr:hypothetical protein [Candidatus Dormibacteraeota bacterium]